MNIQASNKTFQYDIALSFAGEDRAYVEQIAQLLRDRGIRVFYDEFAIAEAWGADLYTLLDEVYRKKSRFAVVFISKHYAAKPWTSHERQSVQARALNELGPYLLPVQLDDSDLPGLRPTVGHVDARRVTVERLVDLIQEKLDGVPGETLPVPQLFRVPRTAEENRQLLTQRPKAWEHLLYAGRQNPEELVLALPGADEDELRYTIGYTIDTSQAIDRVTRESTVKLGKTAVRLALPRVGSLVVDAYEIGELVAGSDLFDYTIAHMLTTVGDAHTVEAGRVLREATAESTVEGKNQLRNRAATLLHEAYSEYSKSIEVKRSKLTAPQDTGLMGFLKSSLRDVMGGAPLRFQLVGELIELHNKAASRAIAISLINRQMGLAPSTISRAEDALEHWLMSYNHQIWIVYPRIALDILLMDMHLLSLGQSPQGMVQYKPTEGFFHSNDEANTLMEAANARIESLQSDSDMTQRLNNLRIKVAKLERLEADKHNFAQLYLSLAQSDNYH